MSVPARGLYELLITEAVESALRALDPRLASARDDLTSAEAPDRIALHMATIVRRVVAALQEDTRVTASSGLVRQLLGVLEEHDKDIQGDIPTTPASVLRSIHGKRPDGTPEVLTKPLIPLLDTALLTNAPGEPRVGSQILAEIDSADRIDVVMAFIRRTGLRPLRHALERHCARGGSMRVLTTTYTGSTELAALEDLQRLGAEVRVSYDTSTTRLHAKSWLLHRASGYSTAYIGSSNLTHSAQVTGLEWNIRVAGARNPDVIDKVRAVFESYWNGPDFVPFRSEEFAARTATTTTRATFFSPVELRAEPFQERLLEQVALARTQGRHRNLIVAATGTGKTVMAAIDYARLRHTLPPARLLFVAHRQEILEQSLATFRHALRDQAFGELWVGGQRPTAFEHVFASVQSLHENALTHIPRDHFEVVIVDEFHHAAAPSYRALLEHLEPKELLGLTATPERSDGLPLLDWFEHRIAAELRLWDAIAQHRLCPFAYYGIHDGLDLREVPWRRGGGYDVAALAGLVTGNDVLANLVLHQLRTHVDDCARMRALGFCVSVDHARYMARVFEAAGIHAVAVWADSSEAERRAALTDLAAGRIQAIFSVDLFNEGVDLPDVDTLLFLRPTDSATLFLQQLGRGLRRSPGKTMCTVLDFVGQHRREFRFDRRFRALLGGTRKDLLDQIEHGFPFLPAGCHMELDPVAADLVLRNVRSSIPSHWHAKAEELRALAATLAANGVDPCLRHYLEHTELELEDVYDADHTWSDLRAAARLPMLPAGPSERPLRRGVSRMLHVDDRLRIDMWTRLLADASPPRLAALPPFEQRLARMLVAQVTDKAVSKATTLQDGLDLLWSHPQVRADLRELLPEMARRVDHLHPHLTTHSDVPLRVHARYSRLEILAAFGVGNGAKVAPWQTGVYWHEASQSDLFAFTLDKTRGGFSPTTRYRDYAISRDLVHWESQSVTRADSTTGHRYQNHVALGSAVMLFARLHADDRAFWFLGPATYVSHESERPMAVRWKLEHPLPGDLFASFAAAVA